MPNESKDQDRNSYTESLRRRITQHSELEKEEIDTLFPTDEDKLNFLKSIDAADKLGENLVIGEAKTANEKVKRDKYDATHVEKQNISSAKKAKKRRQALGAALTDEIKKEEKAIEKEFEKQQKRLPKEHRVSFSDYMAAQNLMSETTSDDDDED